MPIFPCVQQLSWSSCYLEVHPGMQCIVPFVHTGSIPDFMMELWATFATRCRGTLPIRVGFGLVLSLSLNMMPMHCGPRSIGKVSFPSLRFVLATDLETLVVQLNRSATDLPGYLVVRWIAWIRLFRTVKHVPETKNSAADALSRRPATESDHSEAEKEDIDAVLDSLLQYIMRRWKVSILSWQKRILDRGIFGNCEILTDSVAPGKNVWPWNL
jgi:hypothetical protein